MTLIEAAKSGRRFRRKGRQNWIEILSNGCLCVEDPHFLQHMGYKQTSPVFTVRDLTADDYELDEPQKVVKLSELKEAWIKTFGALTDVQKESTFLVKAPQFNKLSESLGLSPAKENQPNGPTI